MQQEGLARRVVILDCDVHQGNGTAAIFASDPTVFTFSIHGARNFPFIKSKATWMSLWPDGTGDRVFWLFGDGAPPGRRAGSSRPGNLLAGADPYVDDAWTYDHDQSCLAERDRIILDLCRGAGLPVAIVMGGGYARQWMMWSTSTWRPSAWRRNFFPPLPYLQLRCDERETERG